MVAKHGVVRMAGEAGLATLRRRYVFPIRPYLETPARDVSVSFRILGHRRTRMKNTVAWGDSVPGIPLTIHFGDLKLYRRLGGKRPESTRVL